MLIQKTKKLKKNKKNENSNKYNNKIGSMPESKSALKIFSFNDYFMHLFRKNKNNKTKLIDKLSTLLEDSLSIEEIIKRAIYLQKVIQFINSKHEEEFNSFSIMKVISNIDNEFIEIMKNAGNIINEF